MNGHIGLIHSILPATVDLHVTIPESHPSAANLGSERVGSGTIVDSDGYILTVHYVTVGASSITATLPDGEQYPAQVAGQDQETGLSLVKISAQDLPHLKLAPADSVALGQPVLMIASSGQVGRRVSGGYVSSMEPYDGQWEYMIDKTIRVTAFNPGFGGGTLANFHGELIGVVSCVVPNGPAAKFGLKQGDIILTVEKREIRSRQELYQEMWKKRPGERISFKILRDDQSFDLDVVGGDRADRYRS